MMRACRASAIACPAWWSFRNTAAFSARALVFMAPTASDRSMNSRALVKSPLRQVLWAKAVLAAPCQARSQAAL